MRVRCLHLWGPWLIGLAAAWVVLAGAVARASAQEERPLPQVGSVSLAYGREGEQCPSREEFVELVAARVGSEPFTGMGGSGDQLVVQLRAARRGFDGQLSVVSGGVTLLERAVHARRCGEVADALALLVAVVLTPREEAVASAATSTLPAPDEASHPPSPLVEESATLESSPVVASEEGAEAPSPAAQNAPSSRAGDELRLELSAAGGAMVGWQPGVAPFAGVSAGLGTSSWSLGAGARFALDARVESAAGVADLGWIAGVLQVCGRFAPLVVCGEALLGRTHGSGSGVDAPQSDDTVTASVGASAAGHWFPTEWIGLGIEAGAEVLLLVPEAWLDGERVWSGGPLAGRLALVVLFRSP